MDISIVVCSFNRCQSLKDTLNSLLTQECYSSFDYEVIIVDNNSNDKTKETVESYMPKFSGRLRYIFECVQGLSFARNRGVREARGDIVSFTDDVILSSKWLLSIWRCYQKYNFNAMGGKVYPLYTDTTPKWIKENKDLLNGPIPYHNYGDDIKIYETLTMRPFVGANMVIRKDSFDKYGLFRTDISPGKKTMGDDTDLFNRLKDAGEKIYYCGKAIVWHKVDIERVNLKYIALWTIASGRYLVIKDRDKERKRNICYFGIPRYLFREIIQQTTALILTIFNKKAFLKQWILIFQNLGMILEYRESNKCLKSA